MKLPNDYNSIKDLINDNKYLKICLYIAGGVTCIWILGKGTVLLADATNNFKKFLKVIKAE
jgi:hypothetical protein